jgi:tricarballylate dehydrogenase
MAGGHFYLGGGTAVQKATGIEDSAEEMFNYIRAVSKEPEDDKIRAYCDDSVEHFDWLEALGFEFERTFWPGKAVIQPGTEGLMYTGNEKVHPFRDLAVPAPRGHKVPVPGDTGGAKLVVDRMADRLAETSAVIRYETGATNLVIEDGRVVGLAWRRFEERGAIRAKAVILAAGGFQANAEWRTRYLGPGWDLAKVRGTRFNTGDGIRMALEIGAMPWGNWSGCHAVGWDRNAPPFGDRDIGDGFQKHSYPFGIMVNAEGRRFVDEGADFRNYTYAKYGRVILNQPQQFAWQVFDKKVLHLLRDEYRIRQVSKVSADTLEALAAKLDGVNAARFLETVRDYNAAVRQDVPFDPNVKDGRSTQGLEIDKSNWANTIDTPPFEAYAVTCGITFTFGGLKIDTQAQVRDVDGRPILGLFAAGELVGGLFYFNYPGGTGLMAGSVFGRIAGASAAGAAAGS